MFSFESPQRGDSNEYIQYTIFNIKKKITITYRKSAAVGFCVKGLKKEFETASHRSFEPLKFYCMGQKSKNGILCTKNTPKNESTKAGTVLTKWC